MAVPHSGVPAPDPTPQDAEVDDLTAATLTVSGASTLAAVSATSLTLSGSLAAASVSIADAAADFTATDVEGALAELQSDHEADSAALTAHIDDAAGAHAASAISIADAANDFTATDVEGALAELQSDAEAHLADTAGAHAASAISILDAANDFTATDVEGALAELQSDHEADSAALTAHIDDTSDAHDASAISVADAGGYYDGTTVEAALQELSVFAAWVPALTGSGGNPTLGSGSNTQGRFFQNGKHVVAYGSINFGTAGVAAGSGTYLISLPATLRTPVNLDGNMLGQGYIFDSSASALRPCIFIRNSDTTALMRLTTDGSLVTAAAPWTWAASDVLIFHFDYEAA